MNLLEIPPERLAGPHCETHGMPYQYYSSFVWPTSMGMRANAEDASMYRPYHMFSCTCLHPHACQRPMISSDWQYALQQPPRQDFVHDSATHQRYGRQFSTQLPPSSAEFTPQLQRPLDHNSTMMSAAQSPFVPYPNAVEALNPLAYYQNDLQDGLVGYTVNQQMNRPSVTDCTLTSSPIENLVETHSASGSECGWQVVEYPHPVSRSSFDSYTSEAHPASVSNPGLTLHIRSDSDSSQSDVLPLSADSFDGFDDGPYTEHSPDSESSLDVVMSHHIPNDLTYQHLDYEYIHKSSYRSCYSPSSSSASDALPSASSSTPRGKKQSNEKCTRSVIKKQTISIKKEASTEKRVGRRRGPLNQDARKRAGEIRKLRACLRCKFLKKTCDKGDPCAGCQPSHARLWQVPCTRIDIKDIAYFMKDWTRDYEYYINPDRVEANIKGFASEERPLWLTHGYGYIFPVDARAVYVHDDKDCFNMKWTESSDKEQSLFKVPAARMASGAKGISLAVLSTYLDRHIDGGFERWVDSHFDGTLFLTDMLKTAYRFLLKTKTPIIRKALKLLVAYNLTLHVTSIAGLPEEENFLGKVLDTNSKFYRKTMAPTMINFEVKYALAELWRQLQKDVLEELSALYSSVYSGDKLKNWPTILMLASLLLAVWEEMQFDAHCRAVDEVAVEKFCADMEATPVGVIVGLFGAISQKLPAFTEWDTEKHHQVLNSNVAVCEAMTEIREHVLKHAQYLKSRSESKFDRHDTDSLSNKFLSRLVIRAS